MMDPFAKELFGEVAAPAKAPPKRWRNWYGGGAFGVSMHCTVCGKDTDLRPHERAGACCRTFPSADIAETWAMARRGPWAEYLGAFPIEEGEA